MGAAVFALVLLVAPAARAFSIDTVATRGCHEEMTAAALRVVRAEFPSAGPVAADRNERALIHDLAFEAPVDLMDLGGASLLIGVRDPDLEGNDGNDLSRLALVHGNPRAQRNHCLHGDSPEPEGSPDALRDCRALILERVEQALDGLDAMSRPDPALRTTLAVYLGVRHRVDASLPTFYVRIGQAIHTIQDSFAHSYRTPDDAYVTAVVNWLDQIGGNFDEATDGPPHSTELDRCDDPDDLRRTRRELAIESATAVLRISLDPARDRAQKIDAVSDLLDQWLSYAPGCSADDRWCDAPERAFSSNGLLEGCHVAASGPGSWGAGAALVLVGLALLRARRRRRTGVLLLLLGVVASTGSARAETPATAQSAAGTAAANVPPPRLTPVPEPGPPNRKQPALGAYMGAGGSLSDPALAATLGVRFRARAHLTLGLDVEWNPWFALNGEERFRTGALNVFGSVIVRIPLAYQEFNLRVTTSAGGSRTLIDLYGVPKGSIGLYVAAYPLGIEWKASRSFYVVINPLGFAASIPQLRGIPFWYPQYRASIGLEFYAG
jgi:MYXO-CTERM domain-containing protein